MSSFTDRIDQVARFGKLGAQDNALLKGAWEVLKAFREDEWPMGDETRRAYETALAVVRRSELRRSAEAEPGFLELEVFAVKRVKGQKARYYLDDGCNIFVVKSGATIPVGSRLTGEFAVQESVREKDEGPIVNFARPSKGVVVEVPAMAGEPRLNPQNGEPLRDEKGSPLFYRQGELGPPILLADFFSP